MNQIALDALVKNEVTSAHIVTGVRNVRIVYQNDAGADVGVQIGDDDCVILNLATKAKAKAGIYEVKMGEVAHG
jgi:hypothetical protein